MMALLALIAFTPAAEPVTIELKPVATAATTVTLADVAQLTGGPDALREFLSRLDLADAPRPNARTHVKRGQIEYRLKLAEIPPTLYRFSGASETLVTTVPTGVTQAKHVESSAAPVIRVRQPVKMFVRLGAVNVVATGESLQDGRVGQVIKLQNTDSKKIVSGKVTGPGTVEIESGVSP